MTWTRPEAAGHALTGHVLKASHARRRGPGPARRRREDRQVIPLHSPDRKVLTRLGAAQLCGYTEEHATDRLMEQHPAGCECCGGGFPLPIRLMGPQSQPRWLRKLIEEWLERIASAAQKVPAALGSTRAEAVPR